DHFNGRIKQVLALMRHAIAPINVSRSPRRLVACALLDCRSRPSIRKCHNDSASMAVHRRLCARRIMNSCYADLVVFKLNLNVVSRCCCTLILRPQGGNRQNCRKTHCSYAVHFVPSPRAGSISIAAFKRNSFTQNFVLASGACVCAPCQRTISYGRFFLFFLLKFLSLCPAKGTV